MLERYRKTVIVVLGRERKMAGKFYASIVGLAISSLPFSLLAEDIVVREFEKIKVASIPQIQDCEMEAKLTYFSPPGSPPRGVSAEHFEVKMTGIDSGEERLWQVVDAKSVKRFRFQREVSIDASSWRCESVGGFARCVVLDSANQRYVMTNPTFTQNGDQLVSSAGEIAGTVVDGKIELDLGFVEKNNFGGQETTLVLTGSVRECRKRRWCEMKNSAPAHWPTPRVVEYEFANCGEAQRFSASNFLAHTYVPLDYPAPEYHDISFSTNSDGAIVASVTLKNFASFEFVQMPRFTWPDMSDEELEKCEKMMNDLSVHEDGHYTVIKRLSKLTSGTVIEASGESEDSALERLEKEIVKTFREWALKVKSYKEDYDEATTHGARQSNGPSVYYLDGEDVMPGGNDVVLLCPHND